MEVFIRDTEYIFEDISRNTTWIKNVSIKKKKKTGYFEIDTKVAEM